MKAQVLPRYGQADVFEVRDLPDPAPGPGEVRIRMRAVGINPLEVKIRNGSLRGQMPVELPAVLGTELAGEIDQVGDGVVSDDLVVGAPVTGFSSHGAYAELVVARATQVAVVPAGLSLKQAAAVPTAAETARRVIRLLDPRPGETLLVNGAAGSVGSAAVQLLSAAGVRVVGTASEDNYAYLRQLGAVPTTYGPGVVERVKALAPDGVDAVFDVAGHDFLDAAVEIRGGTDRIVTIADFSAAAKGVVASWGSLNDISSDAFTPVLELAAAGGFVVHVAEVLPFTDVAAAHRLSEGGHLRGKVVLAGP